MVGVATLGVGITTSRARTGVGAFTRQAGKLTKSATSATKAVQRTTRSMNKLGTSTSTVKRLLVGFGSGLALRAAIRQMAAFEQSMAQVKALLGDRINGGGLQGGFAALEERARELGATTIFTAQQAAEGMKFLTLAGFEAVETYEAVDDVLNLAAAGALNLGEAADIASNIMQAFNIEAEETTRVVDIMASVASQSNTDIRQLGEAIKFAGPVASAAGVSLEQTAAAMGTLGNAGLQASLAGTTLRTSLASMLNPSDKAQRALNGMGITAAELRNELEGEGGLVGAIALLAEHGLEADDAFTIFNRRGAAGMLALTRAVEKDGTLTIQALTQALEEAAGTAEEMAKTMADTLAGDARIAIAAMSELVIQIGDAGLRGAIRGTLQFTTGLISAFTGMTDELAGEDGLTKAMNNGADAGERLKKALEELIPVVQALGVTVGTFMVPSLLKAIAATRAWGLLMRGFGFLSAAISLVAEFGVTLTVLRTIFMGMLGPVSAVVAGLTLFFTSLKLFRGAANDSTTKIRELGDEILNLEKNFEDLETSAQNALIASGEARINEILTRAQVVQREIARLESFGGLSDERRQQLERYNHELGILQLQYGQTNDQLNAWEKSLESSDETAEGTVATLEDINEELDALGGTFAHLKSGQEGAFEDFTSLFNDLNPGIKLMEDFTEKVDMLRNAYRVGTEHEIPGFETQLALLEKQFEENLQALNDGTDAYKAWEQAQKDAKDESEDLEERTQDLADAMAELSLDLAEVSPATRTLGELTKKNVDQFLEGAISAEQYAENIRILGEAFDAGLLGSTEFGDENERQADRVADLWEQAQRRMGDAISGFFRDSLDGFDDFRESVTDLFKDMIADILTLIVQSQIDQALAGQLSGVTSAVTKGTSKGGSGGLFGPGGIGNLFEFGPDGRFFGFEGTVGNIVGGLAGAAVGNAIGRRFGGGDIQTSIGSAIGGAIGSTYGPIGTAIGSALGGAIGGALFGGAESTTGGGINIGVSRGLAAGSEFSEITRSGGVIRNDSVDITTSSLPNAIEDAINSGLSEVARIGEIIGGSGGLIEFSRFAQQIDTLGLTEEEAAEKVAAAVAEVVATGVDVFITQNLNDLSDRFKTAIAPFRVLFRDELIPAFEALATIDASLSTNALDEVTTIIVEGSKTLTDVLREQFQATLDLSSASDNSLGSLTALADSLALTVQSQIELGLALEATRVATQDLFKSTAQIIEESILTPEQIFERRRGTFDSLIDAIENTTDPIELQALSEDANRILLEAFRLLDDSQLDQLVPEFLQTISDLDNLVGNRIETGIAEIEQMTVTLDEQITADLIDAASVFLEAAGIFRDATGNWVLRDLTGRGEIEL